MFWQKPVKNQLKINRKTCPVDYGTNTIVFKPETVNREGTVNANWVYRLALQNQEVRQLVLEVMWKKYSVKLAIF